MGDPGGAWNLDGSHGTSNYRSPGSSSPALPLCAFWLLCWQPGSCGRDSPGFSCGEEAGVRAQLGADFLPDRGPESQEGGDRVPHGCFPSWLEDGAFSPLAGTLLDSWGNLETSPGKERLPSPRVNTLCSAPGGDVELCSLKVGWVGGGEPRPSRGRSSGLPAGENARLGPDGGHSLSHCPHGVGRGEQHGWVGSWVATGGWGPDAWVASWVPGGGQRNP